MAYWRRRVVEACIYGVDLNPLAVELTKLSLWLTCIAADEPLNFIDTPSSELFGSNVFSLQVMQQRLPKAVFKSLKKTIEKGDVLDPTVADDELRALREAEQRAALAELGPVEVEFLRFPDGRLQASLELRKALTAVIRRYRPATVFTHDPTAHIDSGYINHPDHRATGLAALDAI